jgi:hypothetical protein
MKRIVLVVSVLAIAAVAASPADAQDRRQKQLENQLKRLAPDMRLEQVCDAEAMKRIAKEHRGEYRPDRSILFALEQPKVDGDTIEGKGAAFRSKGKWYQYSFKCRTNPERLRVLSFEYRIGEEIPEERWAKHGLYD